MMPVGLLILQGGQSAKVIKHCEETVFLMSTIIGGSCQSSTAPPHSRLRHQQPPTDCHQKYCHPALVLKEGHLQPWHHPEENNSIIWEKFFWCHSYMGFVWRHQLKSCSGRVRRRGEAGRPLLYWTLFLIYEICLQALRSRFITSCLNIVSSKWLWLLTSVRQAVAIL